MGFPGPPGGRTLGAMDARRRRQVIEEVGRMCREDLEPTALHRSVAEVVATALAFDRWCAMSLDPLTGLPTGGFHAEGLPMPLLPRLLALEFGPEPDMGRLADVARAERPVAVLSQLIAEDP